MRPESMPFLNSIDYSNLLKIGSSIEITSYLKKPLAHTIAMMIIDQNIERKFRHHLHELG